MAWFWVSAVSQAYAGDFHVCKPKFILASWLSSEIGISHSSVPNLQCLPIHSEQKPNFIQSPWRVSPLTNVIHHTGTQGISVGSLNVPPGHHGVLQWMHLVTSAQRNAMDMDHVSTLLRLSSSQIDLHIRCNPNQNYSRCFHRNWQYKF